MHLFHKWKNYPSKENDTFLGEKYQREYPDLRECLVCGKVQQFCYDSQGGSWANLKGEKLSIFRRIHNAKADGIDVGDSVKILVETQEKDGE